MENNVENFQSDADPVRPPRRTDPEAILTLASGVLAGVGGVYVATRSALITVIAVFAAVALAAVAISVRR